MARKETPPGLAKKGGLPPGLAKKGGLPPGLAKKQQDRLLPVIELTGYYWDDGLTDPIVEIPSTHQLTLSVRNPTDENYFYNIQLISDAFPTIASNMRPKKLESARITTTVSIGDKQPGVYPVRLVVVESHSNVTVADQIVGTITLQLPPPPPVLKCTPGETRCQGYDLYRCTDEGEWVVSPFSPLCGYVPPGPEPPMPPPPPPEPPPDDPLPELPIPPPDEPYDPGDYWEEPVGEGNLQICLEGAMSCDGYNLYICQDGVMVLSEVNSPTCGYPQETPVAEEPLSPLEEYRTPILIGGASIASALLIALFKATKGV